MKEVIVKYTDPKALSLLKLLSRYFNFSVLPAKKGKTEKKVHKYINGVPMIPGDSTVNIKPLNKIFEGRDLDARKLRVQGWER